MADKYVELLERRARQQMNALNKGQQEAVVDAYRLAGRQLAQGYTGSRSNTATKALYASYTQKIADDTQAIIEEYAMKGSRIYADVEKLIMTEAFKRAGLDTSLVNDKFENMIGSLGKESVKNVIGGKIYQDGVGLSSRIWQSSKIAGRSIQEVIAAGLAQDMGAAQMSKLLQAYVNPTARKVWGNGKIRELLGDGYAAWNKNLEYNALRLARTTLAHTATMSMRQARQINPYATKIKWHSVHAAGRTCQTCEDMDGMIYKTEECPFDHPNGMCYQTHEMEKSLNEIAEELADWCKGAPNEMLDSWWENATGEKPTGALKDNLLHRLITRKELEEMARAHMCNRAAFANVASMVARGEITNKELDAYREIYCRYVGTGNSFNINKYLRNLPKGAKINTYKKTIDALDYAISNFQFEQDVKLRRFVACDYLNGTFGTSESKKICKQIGSVFENKQFLSTTVDSNPYFNNRPAIMTILCDKGTNAFPTINFDEGEIILGRGTSYELVDVIEHTRDNPMKLEYQTRPFDYCGIELVVKILK